MGQLSKVVNDFYIVSLNDTHDTWQGSLYYMARGQTKQKPRHDPTDKAHEAGIQRLYKELSTS